MRKRTLFFISIFFLVLLAGALLASCGPASAPATSAPTSSGNTGNPADGQTLMQQRCSVCHSVSLNKSDHKTADQWKTTVDRMISNGAQLTSQEEQTLIDYLAQNYK
jgi:mono/diheme cytochrome c family protein